MRTCKVYVEYSKMFEIIAMLSVGCLVYLFTKKPKAKVLKRKRPIDPWDGGDILNTSKQT
ncbi:hypothetical protein VA249_33620 [Vibrio alfacsensis]|nr:hypothetical protein VA249_33620 [Vibrio alfacsensis]